MNRTLRKVLMAVVGLVVALGAATVLLGGKGTPTPPVVKHGPVVKATSQASTWDGDGVATYNTTFIRDSNQIQLTSVDYYHLNTAATNVLVNLVVNDTNSTSKPYWLVPQAFEVRSVGLRAWNPLVEIKPDGSSWAVQVYQTNLPTDGLGGTCSSPTFDPSNGLGLLVYSPDGSFTIVLQAPAAPTGSCFDPAQTIPADCATAHAGVSSLEHRLHVLGDQVRHARNKAKARRALRAFRWANDATLAADEATSRSAACNPPRPSGGHPLDAFDHARDRNETIAVVDGSNYRIPSS